MKKFKTAFKKRIVFDDSFRYGAFIIPLFLILGLITTVVLGYTTITQDVKKSTEAVLSDSAVEQRAIFQSKIESQFNVLSYLAASFEEKESSDPDKTRRTMVNALKNSDFERIFTVSANGVIYDEQDKEFASIKKEDYFKKAMSGEQTIGSLQKEGGTIYLLLLQPLKPANTLKRAALCGFYPADTLAKSIISGAYNGRAYSYITDSQGRVIIDTVHKDYLFSHKKSVFANFHDVLTLYKQSRIEGTTFSAVSANMSAGVPTAFYFTFQKVKRYTAFIPLDINGWLLFNTVNGDIIKENICNSVGTMVMRVLLVLLLASLTMVYIIWRENKTHQTLLDEKEQLKVSQQEYRIAAAQSKKSIFRYNIAAAEAVCTYAAASYCHVGSVLKNIPDGVIKSGMIAPESADDYRSFYDSITDGATQASCVVKIYRAKDDFAWYQLDATTLFDDAGNPKYAIISTADVSEQKEQEKNYERWQCVVSSMPKDKTLVIEFDMTADVCESVYGDLDLPGKNIPTAGFKPITDYWLEYNVYREDANEFANFMSSCRLITEFCSGKGEQTLDFRINSHETKCYYKWLNIDVQMLRYNDTDKVKAFIIIKDIHEEKMERLALEALSKEDPLTGVLNRKALTQESAALIKKESAFSHAFIMIDMDSFKTINDTLGHIAGDKAIISVAKALKSIMRAGDIVGRMGGDEFMIVLKNIPRGEIAEKRADIVCQMLRIKINNELAISGSLGIALYPRDGKTFEELYSRADIALYKAKEAGGDRYEFYKYTMGEKRGFTPTPIDVSIADEDLQEARKRQFEQLLHQNEELLTKQSEDERYRIIIEATGAVTFDCHCDSGSFGTSENFAHYALLRQPICRLFTDKMDKSGIHKEDIPLFDTFAAAAALGENCAKAIKLRLEIEGGTYEYSRFHIFFQFDAQGVLKRFIGLIVKE